MTRVALYGNLVVDRIIDQSTFVETKKLGGIANAWRALRLLSPDRHVSLLPTSLGEALVLSDLHNSTRTSRACMNIKLNSVHVDIEASWHHIMYLNSIHDLEFLKHIKSGTISADITTGTLKGLDYLKYVDYLFVSDEDVSITFDELVRKTKGWVIMHSATGSVCSNGKETITLNDVVKYVPNLNVLGAGDTFASAFITSSEESSSVEDMVREAHNKTTRILLEGEK
jgi:sugar/nucleoside kinase (ribokinase family)